MSTISDIPAAELMAGLESLDRWLQDHPDLLALLDDDSRRQLTSAILEGGRRVQLDYRISPTELRVTKLAATGLTNKEIAGELFLAESTIKTHLSSVFQKTATRGRGELSGLYRSGVLGFASR